MKKLMFLLLSIMLVLVLLIGCTKDETNKGTNSIPTDEENVSDDDTGVANTLEAEDMYKNTSVLPDNVKAIETDKIINGYDLCDIHEEDDKLFVLLTQTSKTYEGENALNNLKLCYYDFDTKEFIEIFTVENLNAKNFYFRNENSIRSNYGTENISIDFKGNISTINKDEIEYIYSPDNKYYAYAEDGNLIIKDRESQEIIIKLDAVTDESLPLSDRYSYRLYNWLDNENFIYSRGGWEWSAGFGIVNIKTLEYMVLEDSFIKRIDRLEGKTLYVKYIPYGEEYPISYGHYNLDKTPYKYNDDFDVEKYPELYETFNNVSSPKLLTSDLKYLYIFEEDGEKHEIIIKEFSIGEKKFTKDIKILENQHSPYNYMQYSAVLIENKFLAFYNRAYLYLVDLQND